MKFAPKPPVASVRWIKKDRRAFSLLEMLVAIGIIAILAGLLFTATQAAINEAQQVVCITHLKDIYVDTQTYRTENNDAVVPALIYDTQFNAQSTWQNFVPMWPNATGRSWSQYSCPAAANMPPLGSSCYFGYGISAAVAPIYDASGDLLSGYARWSSIRNPANRLLFVDGQNYVVFCSAITNLPYSPAFRHNGHANGCFVDGHMEVLPYPGTDAPAWPW
jgi:prepilin-type N-terminal cleavage/methylation domain-containing protein/prepilin-type processing-associated H-X9-DG protein